MDNANNQSQILKVSFPSQQLILKFNTIASNYLFAIARGAGRVIEKTFDECMALSDIEEAGFFHAAFKQNLIDVGFYPAKLTYARNERFNFSYPFFIDSVAIAYRKYQERVAPDIFATYTNPFDVGTWICSLLVVFGIICLGTAQLVVNRTRKNRSNFEPLFETLSTLVVGIILALYNVTFTITKLNFHDRTRRPDDGLPYATAKILKGTHRLLLTSMTTGLAELINSSTNDDVIAFRETWKTHPLLIEKDPMRACALLVDPEAARKAGPGVHRFAFMNFRSYIIDNCAEQLGSIDIVSVPELSWTPLAYVVADARGAFTKSLRFAAVHGLYNVEFQRSQSTAPKLKQPASTEQGKNLKAINPAVYFPTICFITGLSISFSFFVLEFVVRCFVGGRKLKLNH